MILLRFKHLFCSATVMFLFIIGFPTLASAGAKIKIDDTKFFQIGMGFRGSLSVNEDGAPSATDPSFNFQHEAMRLYTVSQVHKNIQVEYNTRLNGQSVDVLDAVAKINFGAVDFWLGRQLPPSDRSNLDGPYYLNAAWSFPMVQSFGNTLASGCCGRDNGAAIHGEHKGGKFKWAYGLFEGSSGASDTEDRLKHAGRLDFALGDPEPGFYTGSTYFGAKNLTTIGFVFQAEADAVGTITNKGNFTGFGGDILIERTLGNGAVVDLEGAIYDWDTEDIQDLTLIQGNSYLLLASYLMPNKTSIAGLEGKLQPFFRYQGYNRSMANAAGYHGHHSLAETGINYVIDGFNAKITAFWSVDRDVTETHSGVLAMQFQL